MNTLNEKKNTDGMENASADGFRLANAKEQGDARQGDPVMMKKLSEQMEEIKGLLHSLPSQKEMPPESEKEDMAVREGSWLFIDLKVLFKELLVNAPVLILAALVAGLGFYYLFTADTPLKLRYESVTKVYVLPIGEENTEGETEEPPTYYDMAIGAMLSTDYIEFFKSTDTVAKTIENFQMDITYKKFCKKWLSVSNPADTRIVEIRIRDKDPYLARAIAEFLRDTAISTINSRMDLAEVTVWEDANLPASYPFSPLLLSILLAGLTGVMGCGIVFVIYVLREKIVTPYDVEKRLGLTVLGTVIYDRFLDSRNKKEKRTSVMGRTRLGIETLSANIRCLEGSCRTIAFTGSRKGEGRTTISRLLADRLSAIGSRVLYIDADLRKAGGGLLTTEKGLAQVLEGEASLGQTVAADAETGLAVLPAGPYSGDPLKLFCSAAFRNLLKEAGESYNFVIIDTPPLDSFIDGAVIGRECDGTLLLIGSDDVTKKSVQSTWRKLDQAGCHVLGTVLDKVNRFLL